METLAAHVDLVLDNNTRLQQIIASGELQYDSFNQYQGHPDLETMKRELEREKAVLRNPVHVGMSESGMCTVPRYRGRKRKTCETVPASIVEAIPNNTSSPIQPVALRVAITPVVPVAMSADYRRPEMGAFISVEAAAFACG